MGDDLSPTESEIEQVSDSAATARLLRIPTEDVPTDPQQRRRLLQARAGIVYGLYEVLHDGACSLGSKRVIHQHEKHLLALVAPTPHYIGQTIQDPAIRMTAHMSLKNGCIAVQEWHRRLKEKRGSGVHIAMVVLESDIPGDEITSRERFYVKKYNTLHPNGANLQVPGHRDDYVAADLLVMKRHIASYRRVISRIGSAEALVKTLFQMKKKKAAEFYKAGRNDFDNWCRILSNNSEAEAEIVRKHEEAWSKLCWSERLGLLSHDPKYVREFVEYCQTYSKRRAAWLHKIDFSTVYEHMKAWRLSSIIETREIVQLYDESEKKLSQKQASGRLLLRLPDAEQVAEVRYVLGYILDKRDTERAWKALGFKSMSTGHKWLARWEDDDLTSDVVAAFRADLSMKGAEVTPQESPDEARKRKVADAEQLSADLRAIGPAGCAKKRSISTSQIYEHIKAYQQDPDTTEIMSNLPTSREFMCIAKAEYLRRELVGKAAAHLGVDSADVTEEMVVQYKRDRAQLFRDRVTSLGRGHAARLYKVGESSMRTWAREYKLDKDTADIMSGWPTSVELTNAAKAATKAIEADPDWIKTIP